MLTSSSESRSRLLMRMLQTPSKFLSKKFISSSCVTERENPAMNRERLSTSLSHSSVYVGKGFLRRQNQRINQMK